MAHVLPFSASVGQDEMKLAILIAAVEPRIGVALVCGDRGTGKSDWRRDGPAWPHHDRSRLVDAGGQRWHVQQWPAPAPGAPQMLLVHGTGAATHTWRDVAPRCWPCMPA